MKSTIIQEPFWHCINGFLYDQKYCTHEIYHLLDLRERSYAIGDILLRRCPYCNQLTAVIYEGDFRLFAVSNLTGKYFGHDDEPASFFSERGTVIEKKKWEQFCQDLTKYQLNEDGEYEIPWTQEEIEVLSSLTWKDRMIFPIHDVHKRWWRTEKDCYNKFLKIKGENNG